MLRQEPLVGSVLLCVSTTNLSDYRLRPLLCIEDIYKDQSESPLPTRDYTFIGSRCTVMGWTGSLRVTIGSLLRNNINMRRVRNSLESPWMRCRVKSIKLEVENTTRLHSHKGLLAAAVLLHSTGSQVEREKDPTCNHRVISSYLAYDEVCSCEIYGCGDSFILEPCIQKSMYCGQSRSLTDEIARVYIAFSEAGKVPNVHVRMQLRIYYEIQPLSQVIHMYQEIDIRLEPRAYRSMMAVHSVAGVHYLVWQLDDVPFQLVYRNNALLIAGYARGARYAIPTPLDTVVEENEYVFL